jgi:hypothetical protein
MRIALLLLAAGCYHYTPGSFADVKPWPGAHVVLPCLDLAVDVRRDEQATGPVVGYSFANRCDHDAIVDLPSARVVARDARGRELRLAAYDPRAELRALAVPARIAGAEHIEYNGDFAERELVQVCVDVGAIDRSGATTERWVCSADRLAGAR